MTESRQSTTAKQYITVDNSITLLYTVCNRRKHMKLIINNTSMVPIYEQIMEQVKEAACKGYLKPGDALPSVRKLALSLNVTPNTVAKAYQLLEKEKVIITIRGKGAFLAENASQEVDKGKMQEIKISLKEILSELRYEGYDEEKIASMIHVL